GRLSIGCFHMGENNKPIIVALDVMGADSSPESIIEGGIQAATEYGKDLQIVLVGKKEVIDDYFSKQASPPPNVSVEYAAQAVAMSEAPTEGMRKKDSSIAVGLGMQKQQKAHAFVSAGNTGAVMGTSIMVLGRIEGINRPAIVGLFPSLGENPTLVLDVGANVDCKPATIFQFGLMGSVYASLMTGRTSPKVGLLSIGEEKSKGNEQTLESWKLLKESGLNFIGNVEGRDILNGKADVVATDGFTGNIVLKFTESIKGFLVTKLRRQVDANIFSRVGAALMTPFLRRLKNTFDYSEYGGAPLLGVNGVCIICHGSSSPKAIKNAIKVARDMVRHRISDNIRSELIMSTNRNGSEDNGKSQNNGNGIVRSVSSPDK
ncbi:MAG: phosphate acyltransferase PlsX, partial [Candidatus Zixiibacteriota bacterium]